MLKKTLGLIVLLLMIIAGEIVWLSQTDIQSQWSSLLEAPAEDMYATSTESVDEGMDELSESSYASPAPLSIASLSDARGSVTLLRDGNPLSPIPPFASLQPGDQIVTGEDGTAEIAWSGYGRTLIAPNSTLTISAAEAGEDENSIITKLKLESGRIWTRLEKLLASGSRFEVKASNVVATVRGTSFGVDLKNDSVVNIKVAESQVEVMKTMSPESDESMGDPMMVSAMQECTSSDLKQPLLQVTALDQKMLDSDPFIREGNAAVPQEYLDMEWMAYIEMIINSIPPDQLPADFDRKAFMELMKQYQAQSTNEI